MILNLPFVKEVRDEGKGYEMIDDGGCEREVGEFLYGMVRILKPQWILETGCYHGLSTSFMAQGLVDNNSGYVDTVEFENKHIQESKELWNTLNVTNRIIPYLESSLNFLPRHNYQFIFLDTEPQIRFQELVKFFPYLDEGGYVFIHDLPRSLCQGNINPDHPEIKSYPFGDLPEQIKQWERTGELKRITFPNPRGMCGWYKRHHDDYLC